jgi:hypothetical protein
LTDVKADCARAANFFAEETEHLRMERRIGGRHVRALRAGMLLAVVAMAVGVSAGDWSALHPARARQLTLLYVGADDCPPCRSWQQGAGAAFRATPEFAQVAYREVKSPTLHDVLKDEHWPDDLRAYRDQLDRSAGVPLWLLIADEAIVARGFGASQWQATVLPRLKSLLP